MPRPQHTNRASEISQPQASDRSYPYRASGLGIMARHEDAGIDSYG
jgi:hypothetical protein